MLKVLDQTRLSETCGRSRLFVSDEDAAVGDGGRIADAGETSGFEKIGHFFFGIAFAFSDGHEEGRVGCNGKGTGFVSIDVGIVNDEHSA